MSRELFFAPLRLCVSQERSRAETPRRKELCSGDSGGSLGVVCLDLWSFSGAFGSFPWLSALFLAVRSSQYLGLGSILLNWGRIYCIGFQYSILDSFIIERGPSL